MISAKDAILLWKPETANVAVLPLGHDLSLAERIRKEMGAINPMNPNNTPFYK